MAESIWEAGKLTAIYHPVGRRIDGGSRYRRARFDLLQWASTSGSREELYVVPVSITNADAGDINLKDTGQDAEFGYYGLERVVVEPHEADGHADTWTALHTFGYL